jgi:murein DD-endopeptidase MepM/ murein hydrolase activator NlpD
VPLLALPPGEDDAAGVDRYTLARAPEPFTIVPDRERVTISTYIVSEGDTIFGIADKFGLAPETLFWGNPNKTADLQLLRLGLEMNILPVDGALHICTGQQSIESIANRYGVDSYDIIFSEYNDLSADTLPEDNPAFNTALMIPGGEGETLNVAQTFEVQGSGTGGGQVSIGGGAGSCGLTTVHTAGRGVFSLPVAGGYTFMQDFYPGIHNGVDLAGSTGDPIVAADGGTVVFSGRHNGGYGNLVVIDHGNGFQTYYGHLNSISVRCGAGVSAGQTIGGMGTTGNSTGTHLHFEIHQNGVPVSPLIHLVL